MMPQWDFLDFLRDEAAAFPGFALAMEEPVAGFIEERGRVAGVRYASGREERAGKLVIAADGRSSIARALLPVEALGAPMDVLWFQLPKADDGGDALRGSVQPGRMVVLIDRDTYWQAAFLIPKGSEAQVRARGLDWLREEVRLAFPDIEFPDGAIGSIDDVKLLSVALDRMTRWSPPRPAGDRRRGPCDEPDRRDRHQPRHPGCGRRRQCPGRADGPRRKNRSVAGRVERRRLFPTRVIQAGQKAAQDRIIGNVLAGRPVQRAARHPPARSLPVASPHSRPDRRPRSQAGAGSLPGSAIAASRLTRIASKNCSVVIHA